MSEWLPPIKAYVRDRSLPLEEQYKQLETHHQKETEILLKKVRDSLKEIAEVRHNHDYVVEMRRRGDDIKAQLLAQKNRTIEGLLEEQDRLKKKILSLQEEAEQDRANRLADAEEAERDRLALEYEEGFGDDL